MRLASHLVLALAAGAPYACSAPPASGLPPLHGYVIALGERSLGAAQHEPLEIDPAVFDTIGRDGIGRLVNDGAASVASVTCSIERGTAEFFVCDGRSVAFDGGIARLALPRGEEIAAGERVDYELRGLRALPADASGAWPNLVITFR